MFVGVNRQMLAAVFGMGVLGVSSAAMGCPAHSAPSLATVPGMSLMGGHVAFVLPILAGFLERWWWTRAGVESRALALSIQANIVSTIGVSIGGFFAIGMMYSSSGSLLLGWIGMSVLVATAIELGYVRMRTGELLRWQSILIANVFSAVMIFLVPLWGTLISFAWVIPRGWPILHQNAIAGWTTLICLAIYLVVFFWPNAKVRRPEPERISAFEVLPARTVGGPVGVVEN